MHADKRQDDILAFRRELQRLAQEQVANLTPTQAQQINSYHDAWLAGRGLAGQQLSLAMRITSFCGALALALSVFFLFRLYWGLFTTLAQVTLLIGAALLSFWFAWWLRQRDRSGYFSQIAAALAWACFVVNLLMLGDIFNIATNELTQATSFAQWALYALLLAYLHNSRLLLAVGLACALFAAGRCLDAFYLLVLNGTFSGFETFLLAAILIFVVPLYIRQDRYSGFAAIYRITALIGLFTAILIMAYIDNQSYFNVGMIEAETPYRIGGIISAVLVIWFGIRRNWIEVSYTGLIFFTILVYATVYDWWWYAMPKYLFFLLLGLIALLLLTFLQRLQQLSKHHLKPESRASA